MNMRTDLLIISLGTAETDVHNICGKVDLRNRFEHAFTGF